MSTTATDTLDDTSILEMAGRSFKRMFLMADNITATGSNVFSTTEKLTAIGPDMADDWGKELRDEHDDKFKARAMKRAQRRAKADTKLAKLQAAAEEAAKTG